MQTRRHTPAKVHYPESDGKPIAETDVHRDWMARLIELLKVFFLGKHVYVSGNLLVYYVEGDPKKSVAPDEVRSRTGARARRGIGPATCGAELMSKSTGTEITPLLEGPPMRRQAFTLVEMMVSMALVLFIMVLLSQAFQAGLESFRLLKSFGDMDQKMRGTATLLRRDLAADHFEGRRRISDDSFWTQGPPREGFFRIWHGSPTVIEGQDGDGLPSTRATDHTLHLSVKLRGNKPQDFVSAKVPPALLALPSNFVNQAPDARYQGPSEYSSQWFEVAYYLRKTGSTLLPNSPNATAGTPLFALIRRQLVVVPDNTRLNWGTPIKVSNPDDLAQYAEVSCKKTVLTLAPNASLFPAGGDPLYFNNPTDLTVPTRRFGMLPRNPNRLKSRELAGLPSVPLLDPNDNSQAPGYSERTRVYPMLGETFYQQKLLVGLRPDQIPEWFKPWFLANPPFQDSFSHRGLPVLWQDNPSTQGADVLLTDVVSFEVKVLVPGASAFADLFDLEARGVYTPTNLVFRGMGGPRVFDTWSSVSDGVHDYSNWSHPGGAFSVPAQIRISALQITLRIWDQKTQQTRQITIVQDM